MLVALLLYGYSRGIYSSRQLARACEERVDVMAVTGLNRPDFRTVSDFRKRHLPALQQLFVQVLRLCQAAGLVKLGHVAVDGTKLRANAIKHKAMSYKQMVTQEPKLAAEVASWRDQADATDTAEDAQHGVDCRGDETPDWMADKQRRLARIRAAKAQLEAKAQAGPDSTDPDGPGPSSGMQERGARGSVASPECSRSTTALSGVNTLWRSVGRYVTFCRRAGIGSPQLAWTRTRAHAPCSDASP